LGLLIGGVLPEEYRSDATQYKQRQG
jgi:hypothetical protein